MANAVDSIFLAISLSLNHGFIILRTARQVFELPRFLLSSFTAKNFSIRFVPKLFTREVKLPEDVGPLLFLAC